MEPRQLAMLALLIAVAIIGSGVLIHVLRGLDKEENGDSSSGDDGESKD